MSSAQSPEEIGTAIRAARRAAGLTQSELAARADVGRQWLVAVENGHPRAEIGMVLRVLDALGLGLSTAAAEERDGARPWLTAADAADSIKGELARGDTDFALRLLARAVADLRDLTDPADLRRFLGTPPSTGDHRWDTLLAAVIGRECRLRGIVAPPWTRVPALRSWWFPDDDPILTARTMQRTPVDLQLKGIWLDGKALETL